jgi:dTDP-4-amino-4,6-dideoxygalactose transaminase
MTAPSIFVPAFPTIRPEMWCRLGKGAMRESYPFNDPTAEYFHFARNAIWQAAFDLGLGRDEGEVLVPSYHHGVEIEALIAAGVGVRFYSIGPHFQVDVAEVESLIGPRTRALYLTHFLGFPGPVREMAALARRHGLPLIEDCALALFSADGELPLGVTGDASIFCLYKVLAVPDGGVLLYKDKALASAKRGANGVETPSRRRPAPLTSSLAAVISSTLRNVALRGDGAGRGLRRLVLGLGRRGLKASKIEPVLAGTQHFSRAHAEMGMSPFTQYFLAAQDVASIVARRRRNYKILLAQLSAVSPPLFTALPAGVAPLCYPMLVADNRAFASALVERGIEGVDFWREGHPSCDTGRFPDVARLRRSLVEIPCHQDIDEPTLARMVSVIRDVTLTIPGSAR